MKGAHPKMQVSTNTSCDFGILQSEMRQIMYQKFSTTVTKFTWIFFLCAHEIIEGVVYVGMVARVVLL